MDQTMPELELELPGFRFHPTEQELLDFYLKKMVFGKKFRVDIISFCNIYQYDPWELPELAKNGEREWYFFVPRDRKHGHGGRPNRTTENGFWKATGCDRPIRNMSGSKNIIGLRKTLVFYKGRAPHGCKTDWIMNEYRMPDTCTPPKDIVLCKIYRKAKSLKELEQRAAMEEAMSISNALSPSSTLDAISFTEQQNFTTLVPPNDTVLKIEEECEKENKDFVASSSLRVEFAKERLPELQLPIVSLDWTQDQFWVQFSSPWLGNWTPCANLLNS